MVYTLCTSLATGGQYAVRVVRPKTACGTDITGHIANALIATLHISTVAGHNMAFGVCYGRAFLSTFTAPLSIDYFSVLR